MYLFYNVLVLFAEERWIIVMKRIICGIIIFTLLCSTNLNVYASANDNEEKVDGSLLTDQESAEVTYENLQRGNILNRVIGRITNNGDGTVNIYGAVYGAVTCDKLLLDMTLQKLVNGKWSNVMSFSDSEKNRSYMIKSYNISVTKGYYYRLKLAGIATKNGVSESQLPTTDGIMIN